MPEELFNQNLINPQETTIPPEPDSQIKDIEKDWEDEFYKKTKAKNSKNLIKLSFLERERVATHIKDLYLSEKTAHLEKCDKLDDYDDVYRMRPKSISGADSDTPNYRSPLTTTTIEVIHANVMNVFFTPKDIMRVLPTESNDIPKIKKLDIFGNWSMQNEMVIFERTDRLFHNSTKNGECPYMVHWVKEIGKEIKREMLMNPANPSEPLLDEITQEPLYQEREVDKILYNAPKLEIFSRKDYIIPSNSILDETPEWEMRIRRLTADKIRRGEKEGRYYDKSFEDIEGWATSVSSSIDNTAIKSEGEEKNLEPAEKLFIEFYGRLRVEAIKNDKNDEEQFEELEDEFCALMEIQSETLMYLKKNKFPLKMRPFGLDILLPDDEGRNEGIGVVEFMDGPQNCYDILFNQYIFGTTQSNNPTIFFAPTGNMRDEPIKLKSGYAYPTADPQSINVVKLPPPDQSLYTIMEEVRNFAQLLWGISDISAGIESKIDPSAPARKIEIIVAQGNVRLNLILKRKNRTLQDIFKRWFLLYKENLPPNKWMRITGSDKDNPWKFEKIALSDFALNSIPDFELTGNILTSNKQLEVNKAISIYQLLIQNWMFMPNTAQGQAASHALTKWLADKLDESGGISNFLPQIKQGNIITPEEENARMMQGDIVEPQTGEDYVYHIRVHGTMLANPNMPDEIKQEISKHIQMTVEQMKKDMASKMATAQQAPMPNTGGQFGQPQGAPQAPQGLLPGFGVGRPEAGNTAGV